MSVETKIDNLTDIMTSQCQDIKDIKKVLAGDGYGNIGLVKDFRKLKIEHYKMVSDVRKIKIVGSVLASILTFFITVAHHIQDWLK